jgi:ATP-binding protein involved in chromosome partitioning
MIQKAMAQLLHEVHWGQLDILVLDLPPGTGDSQLTITQQVFLSGTQSLSLYFLFKNFSLTTQIINPSLTWAQLGAVVVTTPHSLAVKDAVKGINMFKKVDVDILGLVQNMSLFKCPHCQGQTHVFGSNERVQNVCKEHSISFLGDIPLDPIIGDDADRGKPTVVSEPESERAGVFVDIAKQVASKIRMDTLA